MSYKYSNVREYQGKLLFEDRKNQNYLEINSDGIKYTRNTNTPTSSYFSLVLDGNNSSANFYETRSNYQMNAKMTAHNIIFKCSGKKQHNIGIDTLNGVYFTDEQNHKQCRMTSDGLFLIDSTTNTSCYLKFENGVLKINGKEIATVENS